MKKRTRTGLKIATILGLLVVPMGHSQNAGASSSSGTRPAVTWGYVNCPAANTGMIEAGLNLRNATYASRSTFHVVPGNTARYASVPDEWTSTEFWRCFPSVFAYSVKSWQGIYDQFDCHDVSPGGVGTGPTWDLEGSRGATRNRWTWVYNTCNW